MALWEQTLAAVPDYSAHPYVVGSTQERARFRRPVVPGDQLRIEVTVAGLAHERGSHGRKNLRRMAPGPPFYSANRDR